MSLVFELSEGPEPWVANRALHAGVQPVPLPGESARPERTHIRALAIRLTLNQALLLEFL